jgi:hypothetical protein
MSDKLWAVSVIQFGDNKLETVFVHAKDWRTAALQNKKIKDMFPEEVSDELEAYPLPETQEDAKQLAFDQDAMIEIVRVPDGK